MGFNLRKEKNHQVRQKGNHNDAQSFPAYISSIFINIHNYHFNWIMQSHKEIHINIEMKESLAEGLVLLRNKHLLEI